MIEQDAAKTDWSMTDNQRDGHEDEVDDGSTAFNERGRFYFWSQAFRTIHHLISAAMWIGIAFFGVQAIEALAGKETSVWASLSLVKSNYGLPWILSAILFVWAMSERKLRQRKTRSMEGHIRELETALDPARSSSGLLPTGETNPKDK